MIRTSPLVSLRQSIQSWNELSRNRRAQHITRWLLGILLVLSGLALQRADTTRSTPLVIDQSLPFIGFELFADWTLFCGLLCFFVRKPNLVQWSMLCMPIFMYTFFTIQGIFQGSIQPTSLAGIAYFFILCMLLCVTYYGYSE